MVIKSYFRVAVNDRVRFESIFQDEAEKFARSVYQAEKVIPVIEEIPRREA
jgi:hypothetical protein